MRRPPSPKANIVAIAKPLTGLGSGLTELAVRRRGDAFRVVYAHPDEIVTGSGNVFRDFGYPDADVRQAKALLGSQIIRIMDAEQLSTRQAEARTGVSHSEFPRIRQANFSRFTIDRLMTILARLGHEVEVSVAVYPHTEPEADADAHHSSP